MTSTQVVRAAFAVLALIATVACAESLGEGPSPRDSSIAIPAAPPTATMSAEPARPTELPPKDDADRRSADVPRHLGAGQVEAAPEGEPPARIVIDSISVDAPVIDLGLADDGSLEVPENWDDTGWYTEGPAPGARGPAVIAGHVDSTAGPAVFYRLDELTPGDTIRVIADSGTVTTFTVDRLERFPKARFPTQAVYGLTADPQLRLITCSGSFDESTGHYQDNTVVYASVTSTD